VDGSVISTPSTKASSCHSFNLGSRPADLGVMHVLCRDEQPRVLLELPIVGEGHPEGFKVVLQSRRSCLAESPAQVLSRADYGLLHTHATSASLRLVA
jgi:hypothetical protein